MMTPQTSVLPAPAGATNDPDVDTAMMMLDRIKGLVGDALGDKDASKLDKPGRINKVARSGDSGTVTVDRASLDEIQALAAQVAAMLPGKRQP
jgi:hypothetical protein